MVVHNQAGVVSFLGSLGIDTLVVTRYHHHVLDHKSQHEHHVTARCHIIWLSPLLII